MKSWIFIFGFTLSANFQAQVLQNSGPSSTAMAGLNVNSANLWSLNNNIGQLVNINSSEIGVSFYQPFILKEFTTSNLLLGIKINNKAFGLNYSNFGNEFLQINCGGFGYSMKLGENLQSGIKLNYFHFNAGEYYNNKSVFTADLGLHAKLTQELNINLTIKNPTLSNLDDFNNEKIPTIMQFGIEYNFSEQLSLNTGINKNIAYPTSFIAAIDYEPTKRIRLKGGIGTQPTIAAFGIGVNLKLFELNFSTQIHQILGWSPDFSITYKFE
tara:strand:+ start:1091 stop:1900 length:810 start_codon:yes stop_codon:yes gene_type:complete